MLVLQHTSVGNVVFTVWLVGPELLEMSEAEKLSSLDLACFI